MLILSPFQIEDDSFEGLVALEYLDVSDNKLRALPAAAIGRLPALKRFKADYNRIGSLRYVVRIHPLSCLFTFLSCLFTS